MDPQINLFAYCVGAPLDKFLCILYGGLALRSVSLFTIGGPFRTVSLHTGPPQICFFAYYLRDPRSDMFFAYYMGPPQISFFAYTMGAPISISLITIYGAPLNFFKIFLRVKLSLGGPPYFLIFRGGGGQVPPLALPPPLRAPMTMYIYTQAHNLDNGEHDLFSFLFF